MLSARNGPPAPTGLDPDAAVAADLVGVWSEAPEGDPAALGTPSFVLRSGTSRVVFAGRVRVIAGESALAAAARARVAWSDGDPDAPGPYAVALPFGAPPGESWHGLTGPLAFAPEVLWWTDGGRALIAAFAPADAAEGLARARAALDDALGRLHAWRPAPRVAPAPRARVHDHPEARQRWGTLVESALEAIVRGEMSKVVLARAIDVELSAAPEPAVILERLWERYPTCRTFWLQGDGCAFAGATPETFAILEGRSLRCDALAGTSAPGAVLMGSDKDRREHGTVVDDLRERLAPLASSVRVDGEPHLLRLANVDHLRTRVTAELLPGVGLPELVASLHPTPAVAGKPRDSALRFIAANEGIDRGLYAGLLGLVGRERAELHVALRCALLRDTRARLFVGAGIVAGSSPAGEWRETALKAEPVLAALGAGE
jgi:isochorismate synthase